MKLIFTEKIGELYDLLQALTIYFSHKNDEEGQDAEDVSKYLGAVDEHIALFFEIQREGTVFALHELFPALLSQTGPSAEKQDFYQFLDADRLRRWIFHFYTGEPFTESLSAIASCITACEMPVRLKYQLLSFCTNPRPTIECLISEMERILNITSSYRFYCQNQLELCRQEILGQKSKEFIRMLSNMEGRVIRWNGRKELYISFCVLNRRIIERQIVCPLVLLGIDYQETLKELDIRSDYDLCEIMKATSTPLRMELFEEVKRHPDGVLLSDLNHYAGVTTTTLSYQLRVLVRSGLLHANHIKNQVCYTVDQECCDYAQRNTNRLFSRGTAFPVREKRRGGGRQWWDEAKSNKAGDLNKPKKRV